MRRRFWPWVTINLHVVGNHNRVNAAGRDVRTALAEAMNDPQRDPETPLNPGPSHRRWGGLAATALTLAAGTVFGITRIESNPPLPSTWPTAMTALCNDGSFSDSRGRSGTCSRHRGVAHWRYAADDPVWQKRGGRSAPLARN